MPVKLVSLDWTPPPQMSPRDVSPELMWGSDKISSRLQAVNGEMGCDNGASLINCADVAVALKYHGTALFALIGQIRG